MKGLIVSDTHGYTHELSALKQRYAGQLDFMIHCGDSELQTDRPEMDGFVAVEGNCDYMGAYPNECLKRFGHLNFFVAHGHLLDVRQSPARLCCRGLEEKADVVCYGHTHFAGCFQEDGMIVINPGSLHLPRNYKEGTYVIFDYDQEQKKAYISYYNQAGQPVHAFSKTFTLNLNN